MKPFPTMLAIKPQQKTKMTRYKNRHSTRLKTYDYSSNGRYFVTICSYKRQSIFGEIVNGEMVLNNVGKIIDEWWNEVPNRFGTVSLDSFQIMPNYMHGIIEIKNDRLRRGVIHHAQNDNIFEIQKSHRHMGLINQTPTVGQVVRHFKAKCSYEIHKIGFNMIVWQRNYHERIIRNERELIAIKAYIEANPANWHKDKNNPIYIDNLA